MKDISLPNVNDFLAVFGSECFVDEDLNYTCKFFDKKKNYLEIFFSEIERTFNLKLKLNEGNTVNIYNEFLSKIMIDAEKQLILIEMVNDNNYESLTISMWPMFSIEFVALNNHY